MCGWFTPPKQNELYCLSSRWPRTVHFILIQREWTKQDFKSNGHGWHRQIWSFLKSQVERWKQDWRALKTPPDGTYSQDLVTIWMVSVPPPWYPFMINHPNLHKKVRTKFLRDAFMAMVSQGRRGVGVSRVRTHPIPSQGRTDRTQELRLSMQGLAVLSLGVWVHKQSQNDAFSWPKRMLDGLNARLSSGVGAGRNPTGSVKSNYGNPLTWMLDVASISISFRHTVRHVIRILQQQPNFPDEALKICACPVFYFTLERLVRCGLFFATRFAACVLFCDGSGQLDHVH